MLLWGGVAASLVLGWVASLWLVQFALRWLEPSQAVAAALLLQAYPFSLFYGAAYTEALYLAASVGALLHYSSGRWLAAGTWAAIAGFSRPNGFVLSVALGLTLVVDLWHRRWLGEASDGWRRFVQPRALVAVAPVLSMLGFSASIWVLTGHPFRWLQLHEAWGREFRALPVLASDYFQRLSAEGLYGYTANAPVDALNLAATVLSVVAIVPVWRRFGPALALFLAANILPPLSMGGVLSMGRLTSTAFPMFLWLAGTLSPSNTAILVVCFAAMQGLTAALFYSWRQLF